MKDLNKIYCGDSLNLIKELEVSPNLIIMSPPDMAETNFTLDEYKIFIKTIYQSAYEKLSNDGVLVSITTDRKYKSSVFLKHIEIINAVTSCNNSNLFNYKIWAKSLKTNLYILNYAHILCFEKGKRKINNKITEFYPDVWLLENDKIKGYKNKDSFPTELIKRLILSFTNKNDLILDPFIGTGKTGKVAVDNKRNFIGFELSQEIIDLANKQWNCFV